MLIYLILSFAPFLAEVLYGYFSYFYFGAHLLGGLWGGLWMFLVYPIYLLILNFYFIDIKVTSYLKAFIIMVLISILRAGETLVYHKIRYGEFLGDVPVELYIITIVISSIIAIASLCIIYYINKKNQW